jgi:DNA polymerase-3 subunit gamma/tau
VAALSEHAPDFPAALDELSALLHRVALAQMVPDSLDPEEPDSARLRDLSRGASMDEVHVAYQMAVLGRPELALASDPRIGLEMLLLRMIAFRPALVITPPGEVASPAKKSEPPAPPVATQSTVATADWPLLYEQLNLTGLVGSVMLHTELTARSDALWQLTLDERHASLFNPRQCDQLQRALTAVLGISPKVEVVIGSVGAATPAAQRAAAAAQQLAAAEAALQDDPRLQALLATFDAAVIPGSIRAPQPEQAAHEDH